MYPYKRRYIESYCQGILGEPAIMATIEIECRQSALSDKYVKMQMPEAHLKSSFVCFSSKFRNNFLTRTSQRDCLIYSCPILMKRTRSVFLTVLSQINAKATMRFLSVFSCARRRASHIKINADSDYSVDRHDVRQFLLIPLRLNRQMKISLVTTSGVSSRRGGSTREISPRGHLEFTLSVSPLLPVAWNRLPTRAHFYAGENESEAISKVSRTKKKGSARGNRSIETRNSRPENLAREEPRASEVRRTSCDSFITVGSLNMIKCGIFPM